MSQLGVKVTDCSYRQLKLLAKKCGFEVIEGKKHCKVKTRDGRFVTTIPRHNRLKRETVKGIVDGLIKFGANVTAS